MQITVKPVLKHAVRQDANSEQKNSKNGSTTAMLSEANTLKGNKLNSLDGEIGKVKESYFDDQHWAIRYLVAETGSWLTDRQVLISPYGLVAVVEEEKTHRYQFDQKADRGQSIREQ